MHATLIRFEGAGRPSFPSAAAPMTSGAATAPFRNDRRDGADLLMPVDYPHPPEISNPKSQIGNRRF
jgi:hypothetical protein